MNSSTSDAELVGQFLKGRTAAFNLLVRRWQQPIYHYLYRMLMHREEAEDLTQQTFITVYNKLDKLNTPEKFKYWLYRIAMNKAKDFLKSKKNKNMLSIDSGTDDGNDYPSPADTLAGTDNTERTMVQKELRELIQIGLQNIPDEQRDILILKQYQGLTFEEIAKITGSSVSTAKSRMYYGLKNLKQALDELAVNVEDYRDYV